MGKHTPGPWTTAAEVVDRTPVVPVLSGPFEVASVRMLARRADNESRAAEMRANARLIAAAPDMLLELTAYHDREWMAAHEDLPAHRAGECPEECMGCAAVAKAEGK